MDYELEECPWNPEHKGTAYIIQFSNGGIAAKCFHDSCSEQSWFTLRDKLEPEWRKSQPENLQDENPISYLTINDVLAQEKDIIPLWGNILFSEAVHLLVANTGIGKLTLVQHCCSCCKCDEFLGAQFSKSLKVLYFDFETPRALRGHKLKAIKGYEKAANNIFIIENPLPIEQLRNGIVKNHFDMMVIDTYDLFFPMDKEDDNGKINKNIIGPLLTLTRETGVSIILVHHCSKGALERDKTQRGRGASVLNNHAHVIFNLETTQDEEILKMDVVKNRFMPNVCVYLKKVCGEFEVVLTPNLLKPSWPKYILKGFGKRRQQLKDILNEVVNMGISEKNYPFGLMTLQTSGRLVKMGEVL